MPTYYIDYDGGNDANNGLSLGAAWKRHPYMAGWSGSYLHVSADRFIFKGGVTWPAACFPLTVAAGGEEDLGNDYYGFDAAWYAGGSWTRPVFDGEYSKAICVALGSISRITLDNFEMKRVTSSANFGYGLITGSNNSNILIDRCYLHGWRTTNVKDDAHGGIIFTSADGGFADTIVVDRCDIENSENSAVQKNGVCVRAVGTIRRSKIHDNSSGVLFCLDFDDSELYNISGDPFEPTYHANGVYLDPSTLNKSVGYIRNSIFHDVAGGANMAYPNVRAGAKAYVYNCLFYGTMSSQLAIEIDPYNYGSEGPGHCYCYNNTVVNYESGKPAINVVTRPVKLGSLTAYNNHVIGTSASLTNASAANTTTISTGNTVIQTPAEATAEGYVLGNFYAPTRGGSTVNTGTDSPDSLFTTDIDGAVRPSLTWDIGAYEYSDAPSDLAATAEGPSSISLSWTNNSDQLTGFHIERSTSGVSGWTVAATVASDATSYLDLGLSPGSNYYYRIQAYNADGVSPYSDTASAMTDAPPIPMPGMQLGTSAMLLSF